MSNDILTRHDVVVLSDIMTMANDGLRVVRLVDFTIYQGIARHLVISPDNFNFPGGNIDVRDTYLRVTLKSGTDVAWSVRELMRDLSVGNFNQYDWS